jgi:ATP-dependent 26S proteasome regulatory subunit
MKPLVRLLREELQLLHEPGSYVGEVVKVMGKSKVLVKVQPEGKYSAYPRRFPIQHLTRVN